VRTSIRFSFMALFAGFVLVLSACSTDSTPPDGLAFQDDSSGDTSSTVAPTTSSTVPRVFRPTDRTCSTSDHSIAFGEEVHLQAPTPSTQGPFSISVPAGTYDITVSSWLGFEDYAGHDMEQWYFSTDSGYTSPLSTDSSPEQIVNNLYSSQTLPETTSITLYHRSPSSAQPNSIHPLCIGFRAVAPPETTTTTTSTTTEAPAVIAAAQTTTTTTTTTAAPTTTTKAVAPPQLALTGPSELSMSLGLAGGAITLAGVAALMAARRSEEDY
jgi:hypothetical protein